MNPTPPRKGFDRLDYEMFVLTHAATKLPMARLHGGAVAQKLREVGLAGSRETTRSDRPPPGLPGTAHSQLQRRPGSLQLTQKLLTDWTPGCEWVKEIPFT